MFMRMDYPVFTKMWTVCEFFSLFDERISSNSISRAQKQCRDIEVCV